MSSLGPVQSLHTEHLGTPKIRRDQYRKIIRLVRENAEHPRVALDLVRNYIQSAPDVIGCVFNDEETHIRVCLRNSFNMTAEYQFSLEAPLIIETPTL